MTASLLLLALPITICTPADPPGDAAEAAYLRGRYRLEWNHVVYGTTYSPSSFLAFRDELWRKGQDYRARAIDDLNEAIRLDPKHSLAHVERGVAWIRLRQLEHARQDF